MANLVTTKIISVTKYLARRAVELAHSHANQSVLDQITEVPGATSFTGTLDDITDGVTNKKVTETEKTNYAAAYSHSQASHAPANAQKNSDITKEEIEAKLIGELSSHSHASSGGLTQQQILRMI